MTELILHPVPPLDRVTLAQLHDSLAILGPTDTARLLLEPQVPTLSPLDFGRAAQLILAWGASPSRTILEARGVNLLSADSVAGLKDIDNLLLAISLADQVLDDAGEDVSASWRPVVAKMMSSKRSLGDIDLHDTSNESAAIFLLGHSPRFDHSTDLHAVEDGEWKIDEEARTLYHSLWPEQAKPTSIRDPLFHLGERRHVSERGVSYVRRELWPDRSPGFRTLAERTLNPSGRIRDRAIAYRAREKTPEDEIGEVLFELIQNTEWHGQGNLPGPRASGFRLIRFQTCTYTRDDVPILAERDSGFARYVDSAIQDLESSSGEESIKLTLGVASIIDCGVGLARRAAIMCDELHLFAPENEILYLGRALSKPTRTIFRKMGSIGLPRVQILMTNLRGFMTIRTGTVELRRDFIANPIKPNAKPLFIEWIPEDFEEFYVGRRYGTDVTIVVPISSAEMTPA